MRRSSSAPAAEPEELATDAIAELEGAVNELTEVIAMLENGSNGAQVASTQGRNATPSDTDV